MQSIYLVRHGEYSNPQKILTGRLPLQLSPEGIKQAELVRDFFQDKKIKAIYSSAVERCKQTSTIISNKKLPIVYDKRLLETLSANQGYWVLDWDKFFGDQEELGGESFQDLQDRMVSFFEELKSKEKENIIICSHADPLFALLLYLKKQPIPTGLRSMLREYPKTGSVTEVQIQDEGRVHISPISLSL